MFENNDLKINISDFQKVFAVTAVMMQTILTFALSNTQDEKTAAFIGTFYVLVKFTAPLFIFAIVYNMVKTSQHLSYLEFLKEKFLNLSCHMCFGRRLIYGSFPLSNKENFILIQQRFY